MNYEQVHDIVSRIASFHRRLRDELERVRPEATDDRTQFVLDAVSRDEEAIKRALEEYREGEGHTPLDTWIQYVPDEQTRRLLDEMHFTADMEPEDLMARKIQIDRSLVELYRRLAEQTSARRVGEFFGRLAERTTQRMSDENWQIRNSDSAPTREPNAE